MNQRELDNDLPAYLVFMILGHIRSLKKINPDHLLVRAVENALDSEPVSNPRQLEFEF